jgi:hypothetical protein
VSDDARYDFVKASAAYAYGDFFVGDLARLKKYNSGSALDIISNDIFEDNFVFSSFNCDEATLFSNIDHVYTIGGLNSFFEANLVIVDYFTNG